MRNHYHILLETPLGNLSAGIKKMNQEFAKLYNKLTVIITVSPFCKLFNEELVVVITT